MATTSGNRAALAPFKSTPPAFAEKLNRRFEVVEASIPKADGHTILNRNGILSLNSGVLGEAWTPLKLVPVNTVQGYTRNEDGADWRRFYVAHGMVNGLQVVGTLFEDGKIMDESMIITVPEDAVNYIVYAEMEVQITGIPHPGRTTTHCTLSFEFDTFPELKSVEDGWEGYPCQHRATRGPDLDPWAGRCWSPYEYTAELVTLPIAKLSVNSTSKVVTIKQHVRDNLDVILYYLGSSNNKPPAYRVAFGISTFIDTHKDLGACGITCNAGDCMDPDGNIGGSDVLPDEYIDLEYPYTRDQIYRAFGSWLYRLYRPPNPGHTDPTNWRTLMMQDGLLYTGSGEEGEGDPIVVSWEGAVVPNGVTDENPFLVVLQVEFSNLCGLGEASGPQFTAMIIADLESNLTLTPELNDKSTTPTGWPTGKTISNTDNGTLYMVIGSITTVSNVMVITEHFRNQASFVLATQGGDDGVTASGGLLIPKHVPHLVCGRGENAIAALLDDICFDDKEVVGDVKLTLDDSGSPDLSYTLQKKVTTRYFYMGALAYEVTATEWTDSSGDTVDGWECVET